MIRVNDEIINIEHFPDGTPRINLNPGSIEAREYDSSHYIIIDWFYESNDELFYLMLVKRHLERYLVDVNYCLYMPYIPNARFDRTKHNSEVFTLKYFCDFINSLDFKAIYVLDAHSDVSTALLNNCVCESPKEYIDTVISEIEKDNSELVLYFPDAGASKRYASMFPRYKYIYGNKVRTWETGEIVGTEIVNPFNVDLKDKTILIIDDICSKGTTFIKSAEALQPYNVGDIYLWITHCEDTIFEGYIPESDLIKKVFTTDSLFTGKHEKIEVMELYEN
jgi:ribose-phosphate pyrophosphokinase